MHSDENKLTLITPEKAYQITAWKAFSILAGAVIVSIVGTTFGLISTYNNDHFRVERNSLRLDQVEAEMVRKDVLDERLTPMQQDIAEIKLDIKELLRQERQK